MKKKIKEFNNYELNNPFVEKATFKEIFMTNAYKVYKYLRIKISPIYSLKNWQKSLWKKNVDIDYFRGHKLKSEENFANITDDNMPPIFNINHITISEILPKEQLNNLRVNLEKLQFAHQVKSVFNNPFDKNIFLSDFKNIVGYSYLGGFNVKNISALYKYTNALNFSIYGLSDTFCRLDITIDLNEDLVESLSKLATSNMNDINYLTGVSGKKWYDFKYICEGSKSGSLHKCEIILHVIEDIKWNVLKEINKYLPYMLFTSSTQKAPSITSIQSNILGNGNENFWHSVGINNISCDFSQKFNGCISWGGNMVSYIYSIKSTEKINLNNLVSDEINKITNEYLAITAICDAIREKISNFAQLFSKTRQRNILKLLKLKNHFDNSIFYESRLLNEYEYKYNGSKDFEGLYNIYFKNKTIIQTKYENLNLIVEKTKNFCLNSKNLYENNISYINTTVNFKMQRRSVIFTIISVIVAIVSLVVAITSIALVNLSNDNILAYIKELIR